MAVDFSGVDVSSFNSGVPSGTSQIKEGDDYLRSMQSDLHETWEEEHFFRAPSDGSAGQHRPGSSRVSFGSGSAVTTGDEGRLFYDISADELILQGSSATTVAGPGFRAARLSNTDAVFSSTTDKSMTWRTLDYDTGGFIPGSTNTDRFVIPRNGVYEVHFNPFLSDDKIDVSSAGSRVYAAIRSVSTGGVDQQAEYHAGQIVAHQIPPINSRFTLQSGDTVFTQVFSNASSALGISDTEAVFDIRYLGTG